MGFASGSYAAEDIWRRIKKYIAPANQKKVAEAIVDEFENLDADDWSYAKGSVYQVARPKEVAELDDA